MARAPARSRSPLAAPSAMRRARLWGLLLSSLREEAPTRAVPVAAGAVFKLTVAVPGVGDAEFDTMSRWFVAHLRGKLSGGCSTETPGAPAVAGACGAQGAEVQRFHSPAPTVGEA